MTAVCYLQGQWHVGFRSMLIYAQKQVIFVAQAIYDRILKIKFKFRSAEIPAQCYSVPLY